MSQDTKRIIKWLVVALIIIGSFIAIIFANQSSNTLATIDTPGTDEPSKGPLDAKVTLVEYSDFQCPACAAREPLVENLINEFGNHLRFVYRYFPLRSIHKNSQISSQAAEAADLQGKFWEMHDLLFANQIAWSNLGSEEAQQTFVGYATQLGLDGEKFKTDLTSNAVENAVNEDYDSGEAAGVTSTPTFFLNGAAINPGTYDEFRTLVREKIEANP